MPAKLTRTLAHTHLKASLQVSQAGANTLPEVPLYVLSHSLLYSFESGPKRIQASVLAHAKHSNFQSRADTWSTRESTYNA